MTIIAMYNSKVSVIIEGNKHDIIPFVGADRSGDFASMGVGFFSDDKKNFSFWGLVIPHALIKSWRGMKLLSHIKHIEIGTLYHCYTSCGCYFCDNALRQKSRKVLSEQFESCEKFDEIMKEIMDSVPSSRELEKMLKILLDNEVSVDGWDLKAEIDAGRIELTDQIQSIFNAEEEVRNAYQKEQNRFSRLLPREESLSSFFKDLNLDNFIIGGGCGIYGLDWGHIDLKELDRIARQDSANEIFNRHKLEITTKCPKTKIVGHEGVATHLTYYGDIKQPCYTVNGKKYVFDYARWDWDDDKFYIGTYIISSKNGMVDSDNIEFTIQELRKVFNC